MFLTSTLFAVSGFEPSDGKSYALPQQASIHVHIFTMVSYFLL